MKNGLLKFVFIFCSAGALFLSGGVFAEGEKSPRTTMLVGDVLNFELPNFDDKTGMKEWELFGEKAVYVDESRIDIEKMRLHLFEDKAGSKLKAVIRSPKASVNPDTKFVKSSENIAVDADDFKLTGSRWDWDGLKKIVRVFGDVKIDFKEGQSKPKPKGTEGDLEIRGKVRASSDYASLNHAGNSNLFELSGNVRVASDDMDIDCDKMEVDAAKHGGAREISASGNVRMKRGKISAQSGSAVVVPANSTALLRGNPQILDASSKSVLSGDSIFLDKLNKGVVASSSAAVRAKTILLHVDDKGKQQTITICADTIKMKDLGNGQEFYFDGGVKVSAPDFTAYCDKMTALSSGESGKENVKIKSIKGSGNVKFVNDDGEALSKNIEIIPERSEVWLTGAARLKDALRGTELKCHSIVFTRQSNSGMAFSDQDNKNSSVLLQIKEDIASDMQKEVGAKPSRKGANKSQKPVEVKSKILRFNRDSDNMFFTFIKDVSINSDLVNLTCAKMRVFAKSQKEGSARVQKIEATDGVRIEQGAGSDDKGAYFACSELATIYPRLDVDGEGKSEHRYVELSIDESKPSVRPFVSLPPVGNLGLDASLPSGAKPSPTVITSDKQWLVSMPDGSEKYFFAGNVDVKGTDMRADCDNIEVVMKAPKLGAQKEIVQIVMRSNIKMRQAMSEVECGKADIYVPEQMIVLSDNPVVVNKQDNTRVTAPRIVYNRGSRKVTFEQGKESEDSEDLSDEGNAQRRPTMTLPSLEKIKPRGGSEQGASKNGGRAMVPTNSAGSLRSR